MKTFKFYRTADARNILDMNERGIYIEIDASSIDVALKRIYKSSKFESGVYCITVLRYDDFDIFGGKFTQCLSL